METKTLIVNLFSSHENIKKNVSWKLAIELLNMGRNIECLSYVPLTIPSSIESLEIAFKQQQAFIHSLLSVEILILRHPLAMWKLYPRELDMYFNNLVDDAIFGCANFNIYLRQSASLEDLKMKSILLSDEMYGEYDPSSISVMAKNIDLSCGRLMGSTTGNIALDSYMDYTALQRLINRYSIEAPSYQGVLGLLEERGIARVSRESEYVCNIEYKNIQVKYKKCSVLGIGTLTDHYNAYEANHHRHRYDYAQQKQYWTK